MGSFENTSIKIIRIIMNELLDSILEFLDNNNYDNDDYQQEDSSFMESLLFDEFNDPTDKDLF